MKHKYVKVEKNVIHAIQQINLFQERFSLDIVFDDGEKKNGKFYKKESKGFEILLEKIDLSWRNKLGFIKEVELIINKKKFISHNFFIKEIASPTAKCDVHNFHTIGFNKKEENIHRLVIPYEKKINFQYFIDSKGLGMIKEDGAQTLFGFSLVETEIIGKGIFHLYKITNKNKQYLIIESNISMPFYEFERSSFAILNSMSFIIGYAPKNEGYYFTYSDEEMIEVKDFYFTELRDSIKTGYSPIYTNPYGFIKNKEIADKYYNTLKRISNTQFDKLANLLYNSSKFSSIIILILESTSSSLLLMPSGLSVALEGITDLINKAHPEKVKPIKSKSIAKKVREEMVTVIDKFKHSKDQEGSQAITEEGFKILNKKIEHINQPTNKSKLIIPFEILKIPLSIEDKRVIEYRNDFLHGRIILDNEELGYEAEAKTNNEIYYISLRLYTLLCALILKYVGFDGRIVNYPKIHEEGLMKIFDEEHCRKI